MREVGLRIWTHLDENLIVKKILLVVIVPFRFPYPLRFLLDVFIGDKYFADLSTFDIRQARFLHYPGPLPVRIKHGRGETQKI